MEEMFGEGWRTPARMTPGACEVDEVLLDDGDTGTPLVDLPIGGIQRG
jgi:hypothetical protein